MSQKLKKLNAVGATYRDFKVVKLVEIAELQCTLRELIHEPTGTHVMHIANDDPENLFCLSFRTLPSNSNGVAHILEHTVLCGSEKYPVKDPFFSMTRRSLNTFMNALTGADFTCYPASSQVSKDFYNLLDVYLDAVFHPNLDELSFLQEGHRLEFTIPNDPESPLVHRGIVFNEMKGALNSPSTRLMEAMNQALFPDVTYGCNSGGDPREIPELTYGALRAFHETYYHPSRCLFYFYGDMPLEDHLDYILEHTLKKAKKVDPLPPVALQPRFKHPKYLELTYPISPDEDTIEKTIVSFGWLTCHILQQEEVLALSILDVILMDTDASPLKHALLKSGLCKQVSATMDCDISEIPIMITLKGCREDSADAIEKVIFDTLHDIVEKGISLESLENALHQLEFYRSEITGNHTPFGLSLFWRSGLLKQHGGNPEDGLIIHQLCECLRKKHFENPHYFSELIKKYFLDNTHRVRIVMTPDKELTAKELEEEKNNLEKVKNELSSGQIKQILEKTQQLNTFQQKQEEEDIDLLPKIALSDVPKASRYYELSKETVGNLQLFHHTCFTNEIVYADLTYDLPEINESELAYLRLFSALAPQMGCGARNYIDNLKYIQAHTGGINAFLTMNLQVDNPNEFHPMFVIRGKALHHKVNKLFPLFYDMVSYIDFKDLARLKEVLLKHYTSLHSTLTQSALKYAVNLSTSALNMPSRISNAWYGVEYYQTIKQIAEEIDQQLEPVSQKLTELHHRLLGLRNPHLIISSDAKIYSEIKDHDFYGLINLPCRSAPKWRPNFSIPDVENQGRVIASPVAFVSQVIKALPYTDPNTPALSLAACLFDNLVLHNRIREQGGAYGGGAVNNTLAGSFYFYSYRDPNINSSLKAFEEAVKAVIEGNFNEDDLEEAKLEIIQGLDAPVAPGSRADLAYGWYREGKTPEIRQAFRNRLLEISKEEIIDAVKTHIIPQLPTSKTVIFAGKDLLEKENQLLIEANKSPLVIKSLA